MKTLSGVAEERGVKIIHGCQITDTDEARPAVHFEDRSVVEAVSQFSHVNMCQQGFALSYEM